MNKEKPVYRPVYRIAKWRKTFETADSRRFTTLPWVSVPTDFISNGYAKMIEEFGDESPAIFGAWIALVKIAATCSERGLLSTSSGIGLTTARLSFMSHFPSSVFEKLLPWASSPEIAWLEVLSVEQAKQCINGHQSTADQVKTGLPDQNLTRPEPNITTTKPDQTKPVVGLSVVGREVKLNWEWSFDDLDREAQRFRKVSQLTQSALSSKTLGRLAGFGLAVGVEFLHDLASTIRHAKEPIKRPPKYVEAAIRKFCEERGIPPESVMEPVEGTLELMAKK